MELCEGGFTLINMLTYCKNKIPEHVILSMMRDVCQGVKWMHQKGIAHRDLKVENILLMDHKFKVADFGSASKDTIKWEQL
jgi:serine/threonine protein kinase